MGRDRLPWWLQAGDAGGSGLPDQNGLWLGREARL